MCSVRGECGSYVPIFESPIFTPSGGAAKKLFP